LILKYKLDAVDFAERNKAAVLIEAGGFYPRFYGNKYTMHLID